jgi:hypothetical protein
VVRHELSHVLRVALGSVGSRFLPNVFITVFGGKLSGSGGAPVIRRFHHGSPLSGGMGVRALSVPL